MNPKIVIITCPDRKSSEHIARDLVQSKLCACISIVPSVLSIYWWEGRVQTESEELLLAKTSDSCLLGLKHRLKQLHPYQTPEFIVLNPEHVDESYRNWLESVLKT